MCISAGSSLRSWPPRWGTSSLCYARRWRVDLLGYPHPLAARDDATSALSRNGTTQADPSRNLETTRLTSSGGREPATGTTRPKFIDPWLDHHGGPRKLPPESGLGLVSIGHTACSGECFLGCVRVLR